MGALTLEETADRVGVTVASIRNWVDAKQVPTEKVGKRAYVDEDIADTIKVLRDEHGKAWARHAHWLVGDDGDETEQDEKETPTALNNSLLQLAKKYRAAGYEKIACVLFEALVEQYDF